MTWSIPMKSLPIVSGLILLVPLAACPSTSRGPADPEVAARTYLRALAKGDYRTAYRLLGPELRKRVSLRRFKANLENLDDRERKAYLAALEKRATVKKRITLRIAPDRTLVFEERKGKWYLVSDPFAFYPQDTPRHALRSFLRAAKRRRYRILMRFVPRKDRRFMSPADIRKMFEGPQRTRFLRILKRIQAASDGPIEVQGNQAVLYYGDGARLVLVREEGRWVIDTFE